MPCQLYYFFRIGNRSGRSGQVFTQIHHFSGLPLQNKHPKYIMDTTTRYFVFPGQYASGSTLLVKCEADLHYWYWGRREE
jgi:hypothetical protein